MLVWKDMKSELRGGQFILSSLAFGILLVLIIGMAMNADSRFNADWRAGLLWMSLFFSTAISMNRHDDRDRLLGGWLGVLLTPIDRSLIYYAKWVSTSVFVLIAEAGMVMAYFVILNQPLPHRLFPFIWVFVGGTIALTGVGTFVATLAANSAMKDLLTPLLLFPITIPLFLALIRLTVYTFAPDYAFPGIWLEVFLGYIVAFLLLPWLLYETLMEV
jgi:heme exporter protein B